MLQQGQAFELSTGRPDGKGLWAYRYRVGGRESKRVQRGGFRSEADARAALERALEKLRRESGGRKKAHVRRVRRRVPRTARGLAGDAHEVALPARPRSAKLRRLLPRRAFPGGDLGLADDGPARLPIRSDTGASAGARPSGPLADARHQPREAGGREPAAAPTARPRPRSAMPPSSAACTPSPPSSHSGPTSSGASAAR